MHRSAGLFKSAEMVKTHTGGVTTGQSIIIVKLWTEPRDKIYSKTGTELHRFQVSNSKTVPLKSLCKAFLKTHEVIYSYISYASLLE